MKNEFVEQVIKDLSFLILPFLILFFIQLELDQFVIGRLFLSFMHVFSIFYFMLFIAERIKMGYTEIRLIISISIAIIYLCAVNAAYYLCYQILDSESFSNVPSNPIEAYFELLFFSIGNMFYNNVTKIQPTIFFTKLIIHVQMIISFVVIVLFFSFIRSKNEINKK